MTGKNRVVAKVGTSDIDPEMIYGITSEEMEAIRLVDHLNFYCENAAVKMKVSRSQLDSLLKSGRRKITKALFSGKGILVSRD